MKTTTPSTLSRIASLAWAALFLCSVARAQDAPPTNAFGEEYRAWKQEQVGTARAAVTPSLGDQATPVAHSEGGLLVSYPGDGGWTEIPRNDDGSSGIVPLGFDLEFYGTTHPDVCVNNNGNISFVECFSTFTATGFPSPNFTMIAPFWADVDTGCETCGLVYFKQTTFNGSSAFVAHWEAVGYFSVHDDKLNTFQVVVTDTPVLPGGNNVCFGYGEMSWTTGDFSGGTEGFGGTPSTVGANAGDGVSFFQYGRFDHEGADYDGPDGNADGVSFLDGSQICFNTGASSSNIPPVASGFSDGDTFTIEVGEAFSQTFTFISPETGQTTTIGVDAPTLPNLFAPTTPGNPATIQLIFTPESGQEGLHEVALTALDDGIPPLGTSVTISLNVTEGAINVIPLVEPTVDEDLDIAVQVTGFEPTSADLYYRLSGSSNYSAIPLIQTGDAYEATIPSAAVTLRGVDYYIELSDDTEVITFPSADPEANPAHLRVAVDAALTAAPPPPDGSYRMVSIPVDLVEPSASAVFADDYGNYIPSLWRLLRWLPDQEAYAEFPDIGAELTPGTSVWLATRFSEPFDVENGQSVDASRPFDIVLQPGFNQIASPFAFPVLWDGISGSELVGPPAAWNGVEYALDQDLLVPWEGAFVENRTDEAITVSVDPMEAPAGALPGETPFVDARVGYGLRLVATTAAGLRDTQNLAAFAAEARNGRDAMDIGEPPPPGEHIRLSFVPDANPRAVRLAHSYQPDTGEGSVWEVEVTATSELLRSAPMPVSVALVDEGVLPDGYGVRVIDLDRATALSTESGLLSVTISAFEPLRRLRLIIGTDAFADANSGDIGALPLDFALNAAYPNPAHGPVNIPYQLAASSAVELSVYDLLGRRVAVLVDGEQDAGRHLRTWNAEGLASGMYIYRLKAEAFSDTGKLILVR